MNKHHLFAISAILISAVAPAQNIISRTSKQTYNYVYGAGGDSNADSFEEIRTTIVDSDFMSQSFSGATQGTLPGGTQYTASVDHSSTQAYSIYGPLNNFESILVESDSLTRATTTGAGTALMQSINPGNQLILEFDVATSIDYQLSGYISVTPSEAGASNLVALQKFDGIVWQQVFNSLFLPGQQGSFDVSGTLTPGLYRMNSAIGISAIGNEETTGVYYYSFENLSAVPEPITMFAIAPALMLIARKRKRA